jgi:hypothetical protein
MKGLLSKLRNEKEVLIGRLDLGSTLKRKQKDFVVGETGWSLNYRNLSSALFALPSRACSQVRPSNAGTAFSKPGVGPFFASKPVHI